MSFLEQAKLNPQQREACRITEGPLLILAGAGSGKTRVLTHRIAHLILDKQTEPWQIMAITFTNKAAKEMKERIASVCGQMGENVWVSTFHAACVRILHREIEAIGYSKDFTIYDDDDQIKLLKELVAARNLSEKEYEPKVLCYVIDQAKNAMQSPGQLAQTATSQREENFAALYEDYEKKMRASNALDFNDLILKTIQLFSEHPDVLNHYATRFRYIHVDEYQDTNMAQYKLVRQLSSKWGNLCVVGDDDQSIYGWRGADIRNILEFEKDFSHAKVIKLEQNYRSTNHILKSANAVIAHNDKRKQKVLWSDKGEGEKIRVEVLPDGRSEAAFVVQEIMLTCKEGASYSDFAVLYRTNSQSRLLEEMLLGAGIPSEVYGGQPFYSRKEVKDAIAYLRILTNPDDEIALRRIINVPKRGIGDSAVAELASLARQSGDSMLGVILDHASHPLSGRIRSRIAAFSALVDELMAQSMMMEPAEFVDFMLEKTGLLDMYRENRDDDSQDRFDNLKELSDAAHAYFEDNPEASVRDYLVNIALVSDPEANDLFGSERGRVTLMTLHAAKGLEFPTVFMVGMEENLFPLSRCQNSPEEMEEERRLCYVGITRAQKKLYLLRASLRFQYGEGRVNPASRFLSEIPENYCESLLPPAIENHDRDWGSRSVSYAEEPWGGFENDSEPAFLEQKSGIRKGEYHFKQPEKKTDNSVLWRIGMKVTHRRFGKGTVITVKGSGDQTLLTIAFENNGMKNLVAAQANLQITEE